MNPELLPIIIAPQRQVLARLGPLMHLATRPLSLRWWGNAGPRSGITWSLAREAMAAKRDSVPVWKSGAAFVRFVERTDPPVYEP